MKLKHQRNSFAPDKNCYRVQDPPIYQDDMEIHATTNGRYFIYLTPEVKDWFHDLEVKIKEDMTSKHPDLIWISPLALAGVRQILHISLTRKQNRDYSVILLPLFVTYHKQTKEARLKILAQPDRSMERLSDEISDMQF